MRQRSLVVLVAAFAVLAFLPALALAQSSIAGVVRDTSGAVLPGVTVEASSPALIEKMRSAVTDGEGAYRVVDLRPGLYTVMFSLPGFTSVKRDGIALPAAFTATVNVVLGVGTLEETVTVSGAAPLVDIQSASSERQLSAELLEAIPASRSPQGFAALTPGIVSPGINTIGGGREEMNLSNHGSRNQESLFLIDGHNTSQMESVGGANNVFRISASYIAEMNVTTGGGTAEFAFSGTVSNVIPKEGGNAFSGSLYTDYSTSALQANNLTPELRAQGLNDATRIVRLWDFSPAVGGPLVKDKIWVFASFRNSSNTQTRAGIYENLTPTGWTYTPDRSRPAVIRITDDSYNGRLTWQLTPKHKLALFADFQPHIVWQRGYQGNSSPEATAYTPYLPNANRIASWKSVPTGRLLFEISGSHNSVDSDQRRQPGVGFDVISAYETSTGTMFRAISAVAGSGNINYGHRANSGYRSKASVAYVTGSHSVKAGLQYAHGSSWYSNNINGDRAYSLRNGVPTSITQWAGEYTYENMIHADVGLFVQDQWTVKRLTVNAGLRFDYLNLGAVAQDLPAGAYVPARHFDGTSGQPLWRDVSPRIGVSYDLFGDGKTAVKATFGRFVQAQGSGSGGINDNNPVVRSVVSVTRTWADADRDFDPDCDLVNPLMNGECGQISNLNFGQINPNATRYADELMTGLRPYNLEYTAHVQRQVFSGLSINAGYYRREFANFTANDNQFVEPKDFSHYCITAPLDQRLPGGGGNQICGLYDVSPSLFGRNQTVVTSAGHYGKQTQIYDGFDLTQNLRLSQGAQISGGLNWGRTKTSACFAVDSPGAMRFCEITPPFQPNATFSGFVPLPWLGLVTSATYRNFPGTQITATYQASNAEIVPTLGRNLSNGPNGTVNIELIEPGTMYGPRQQSVDFRVSKRTRIGSRRVTANLDIYNLLNSSGIATVNLTYGPNWQRPTLVQLARYVKISFQVDF
jgi:hypothetical protein